MWPAASSLVEDNLEGFVALMRTTKKVLCFDLMSLRVRRRASRRAEGWREGFVLGGRVVVVEVPMVVEARDLAMVSQMSSSALSGFAGTVDGVLRVLCSWLEAGLFCLGSYTDEGSMSLKSEATRVSPSNVPYAGESRRVFTSRVERVLAPVFTRWRGAVIEALSSLRTAGVK